MNNKVGGDHDLTKVNMQIELDQKTETIHKINEYLRHGGLFNPEQMDPEAVRDMLLEVRASVASVKIQHESIPCGPRSTRHLDNRIVLHSLTRGKRRHSKETLCKN